MIFHHRSDTDIIYKGMVWYGAMLGRLITMAKFLSLFLSPLLLLTITTYHTSSHVIKTSLLLTLKYFEV